MRKKLLKAEKRESLKRKQRNYREDGRSVFKIIKIRQSRSHS
jgi:hypothetical protein